MAVRSMSDRVAVENSERFWNLPRFPVGQSGKSRSMSNDEDGNGMSKKTDSGRWTKVVHFCKRPISLPRDGDVGSEWQCGGCGSKWMWTVTRGSLFVGSPWQLVGGDIPVKAKKVM